MIELLGVFIGGILFGVVLSAVFFCAALILVSKEKDVTEPVKQPAPKNKELMSLCKQQAEMANFWTYDGSRQQDSEEIAQTMYDKAVMKRG